MQTDENSLIGKTLRDKYRIDRILTETTGQGKIYFATDITSSITKQYIVKQFDPKYENKAQFQIAKRLFDREAAILQKLGNCSQIPQIFEHFEAESQFYLVQELIDGHNLQKELKQKKQFTQSEAIALLKDVLDVLKFVHRNNCIHRDIKPANLIRNKHDRKIYLIDFGAVKEKIKPENLDERGNYCLTVSIGTKGYMPVEQLRGMPEFSSDIYALGMVAVQALTGINPRSLAYDDSLNPQWLRYLSTEDCNYNPNLIKIIDRMVRGQHKERYQSVEEVLQDWHCLDNTLIEVNPSNINLNGEYAGATDNNNKNKKHLFAPVMIAISTIAIILGGSFFAYKNWSQPKYVAYDNADYGIKLDCPEDWSIREDSDFQKSGVVFISPQENANDDFQEKVKISIEKLTKTLSLNEYTDEAVREIEASNTVIEQPKNITFANREGRQVIYQGEDGIKRIEVWTVRDKKAYVATYTAEKKKFDKFAKQANKIIESFAIAEN